MLNIEQKEDSAEKLAAVQGKPTKHYLFAEEVNQIVSGLNNLGAVVNPDRIISLGTETISGNQRTYEGYKWQINGVEVNNIGNPIELIFPSATAGFKRNDISVFKADGTIERIAGIETDGEIVSPPDVPEGTLYFKTYSIDGNVVESEPEPPTIDGSIFKKKSENSSLKITATGEDIIINLSLAGQMHYIVTSPSLISVAGFSPHLLNMGGNPLYPGQDLIFENQTGNPVTLINAHGFAPIKFNEGADIIVPNGGKIWFRINVGFAELMMKSWSEVDLSTKADLVGGKVPLSQLPAISQDLKLLHKNHVSGISVVNNPNITYKYAYGVLIPGGTIQVGDFIDIEVSFEKVSGGNAELYPRIGINTINGTAGEVVISYTFHGSGSVYAKIQRSLVVKSSTLTEILHHGTSSGISWISAGASGNKNIDWSTDKYVVISIANNGPLDATWRVSSVIITKK